MRNVLPVAAFFSGLVVCSASRILYCLLLRHGEISVPRARPTLACPARDCQAACT